MRNGVAALTPLASELSDLKRIRDAASPDSLAVRAFRSAWSRLAAGEPAEAVALSTTAAAVTATRLAGIDLATLQALGVPNPAAILQRSLDDAGQALPAALRATLGHHLGPAPAAPAPPAFVETLVRQPRAGATCPGKPRLVLDPQENHGDHCLVVAVVGVLFTSHFGANPATVFVAGLAHHLHNARLPDSGFMGEVLLGDELAPLVQTLFRTELATLAPEIADTVRAALATTTNADTPEGRAFNAADVIDRVLQMRQYERMASFTTARALEDLELVHAGPLQSFHQSVLAHAGLR